MQSGPFALHDPHAYLGVHLDRNMKIIRQLRPGAIEVY